VNSQKFNEILDNRIKLMQSVLASKEKEYAENNDRLHNFNRAASMLGVSRESALIGMWTKHIISILDIVNKFDVIRLVPKEKRKTIHNLPSVAMIEEKIGDAINYLVLLEAMMKEDLEKG
jgi:hypothetical protein